VTSVAGTAAGVAFVTIAVGSLLYVVAGNSSTARLQDFGVSCSPSTLVLTSIYVLTTVSLQLAIGVSAAIAVYFWADGRPLRLWLAVAVLTLPYAIPSAIGLTMFQFLVADGSTLQRALFPEGSPLAGTWSRFGLMTILGIWQFFPFTFLLILAAFLAVPSEMLSSARNDGAAPRHLVRHFLLPAALPVIAAAAALRTALMLTKVDAPLAFHLTSSHDYACLAGVRIYSSLSIGGNSVQLGLVLVLCATVLLVLLVGHLFVARLES